uniref:Mitochondrial escape protein 2 n=1 Tax=Kwoniella dejecticola CBS 10117 TaxID=1296121 RepID=A0A1A6A6K0_9TREE|nr:exonuclease [Kwoniella dejecticola CBS 10117]OBR85684.1 exonuclease [Kwoniella dejecticola CBS 10117]
MIRPRSLALRRIIPSQPLPLSVLRLSRSPALQPGFPLSARYNSTNPPISPNTPSQSSVPSPRQLSSFYISNVLPLKITYWDFRPSLANFLREESLLERIHDITQDIDLYDFKLESLEISRKDGGVFLHFSYLPPKAGPTEVSAGHSEVEKDVVGSQISGVPASDPSAPGRLFIEALEKAAQKNGGWPNWLGDWYVSQKSSLLQNTSIVPGHALYSVTDQQGLKKGDEGEKKDLEVNTGMGRVWIVKGRQWTEDMNRFPTGRLRVEFDGPDVSQEMLYTLFRPYGRIADIQPPSPVPAGSLRFATITYSRLSPAAIAINCLHGFSTPTNTADFTLKTSGSASSSTIPKSRLRIFYERPLKAHAIRDWISAHPRIALPVIAFLIGTLSYTFFDPIRAFFVRSKLEGVWDIEQYSLIKTLRQKFVLPTSFGFLSSSSANTGESEEAIGKDAWQDRVEAEKDVERWLSEYPSTFITITGPPGSGKVSLVSRVLKQQAKPALVIDCAEIAKAKNDKGLLDALADQTGYYPVFSFMSSISGLIDLAAVGLIGQKAGFSTPIDQQLRQILEIVGGALKDVSTHAQQEHQQETQHLKDNADIAIERERQRRLIARGGWHDGRLDCLAGNGVMSELGVGDEPYLEGDLDLAPPPLMDDTAPIRGEAVPPTSASLPAPKQASPEEIAAKAAQQAANADLDAESEEIKSLPIVVLKNFAQKTAKGDLWTVLSEWGASLVENKVAHVIVVTEGATATKALTKALPAKPLNNIGLSDADESNALSYVKDKLNTGSTGTMFSLSNDDSAQIAKLGGRMVDLETLVYKVRTGTSIKDAVEDIILRNTVELRKAAFGDDAEDAKSLPWNRSQAWKVVKELASKGEISYAQLLQDFPFKGAEQALKALEEHELVSVSYVDGRASKVRPGKPVFRYAFEALVNDPIFKASNQIEYNTTLINKAENDIKTYENELNSLKGIITDGGSEALGVNNNWLGIGGHSAIKERSKWLLDKMLKNVDKTGKLEKENEEMMKILASGAA